MDAACVEGLPRSYLCGCTLRVVSYGSSVFTSSLANTCRWGAAAMSSGAVKSYAGLITARTFLGIFEAAFGAGAPYFLSLFYQRRELARRVAVLLGMSPLANCFASALAYGITHARNTIEPWRLLLLVGTIFLLFYKQQSPSSAC